MAIKKSKKINGYTRSKTVMDLREGYKIKDPAKIIHVKPHYRKKRK